MIPSLAWKNVWRNKTRSMVVIAAVIVGTVAGIFFGAWMQGMFSQKVHSTIKTEVGHLKMVNSNYLIDEDIHYVIDGFDMVEEYLNNQPDIKAWTAHNKVEAMASTARSSAGVTLVGIDPEKEKETSDLYTKMIDGSDSYFTKASKNPTVIIGDKLAEALRIKNFKITEENLQTMLENDLPQVTAGKLKPLIGKRFITKKKFEKAISTVLSTDELKSYNLKIRRYAQYITRSKITFSFANVAGEINYLTCRVSGVFKTLNAPFDLKNVFIRKEALAEATGLFPNQYHEITIVANDNLNADDLANIQPLKNTLANQFKDLEVMDIKQIAPEAYGFQAMSKPSMYVIMILIYFALAFGIINTMLMAIMDRIKEMGMLRAIGMDKSKVKKMIRYETIMLTLIGTIIGMVLSLILVGITGRTGVNLLGQGFEDLGFAPVVYPKIMPEFFIISIVIVICVGFLASIIPVRKALKSKPIEALRTE